MRHSRTFTLSLALAILIGLALGNAAPAHGATAILQFVNASSLVCTGTSISFDVSQTRDYPAEPTIEWLDEGRVDDTLVEGPTTSASPSPTVGTFGPTSYSFSIPPRPLPGASYTYKRVWSLFQGGVELSRSTLQLSCNWDSTGLIYNAGAILITNEVFAPASDPPATATATATVGGLVVPGAAVDLPFAGPGLPGPGARNLVLFNEDTAVLSAPDGIFTGRIIRACQTAFVITTSEDAVYGQLFVLGGWVPMENTRDVPEDYGQPGSPIAPDCVGK